MDDIQKAIQQGQSGDSRPTIERGSYGDRGVLEQGRPDGVGKPTEDQTIAVKVAVPKGSKLGAHAAEIGGMLGETARYGGFGATHPATGSPTPKE